MTGVNVPGTAARVFVEGSVITGNNVGVNLKGIGGVANKAFVENSVIKVARGNDTSFQLRFAAVTDSWRPVANQTADDIARFLGYHLHPRGRPNVDLTLDRWRGVVFHGGCKIGQRGLVLLW
jgi:hypothetical protein